MSEDRRDEETPEADEEHADRREFLKKAGIAAGALAMAGLGAAAEAADIRIRGGAQPRVQTPRGGFGRFQLALPNTTQQYIQSFGMLKESGQAGPRASEAWSDPMAKLTPEGRVAGVVIMELSQRQQALPDVGTNIAVLFTMLANGLGNAANANNPALAGDMRAAGNTCGSGCGYGCMAPVAGGFICGNDCSLTMGLNARTQPAGLAEHAGGFICGNDCMGTGLENLTIDTKGAVLGDVKFDGLNMGQVASAMRNAAQAYGQVFG